MWSYRACRKFTIHAGKKYPFYCVVEHFARIPKLKGTGFSKAWSLDPESPRGDSRKELIQCLEMMLEDLKKYPRVIHERKPWKDINQERNQ